MKALAYGSLTARRTKSDIPTGWISFSSEGAKLGGTYSVTKLDKGYIIGQQLNLGAGLLAEPLPGSIAVETSNTFVFYDFAQ